MIFNLSRGGSGSAALNFNVVAYESEGSLQAATPKENTIGIITTAPITGWSFADMSDPGHSMPEGFVYIHTETSDGGTQQAFNALKKNEIMLRPISAKQYVSGAWVTVAAKIYQSGTWVNCAQTWYLYNHGINGVDGGWDNHWEGANRQTIEFEADHMSSYVSSSSASSTNLAVIGTAGSIDLSNYSKITINYNMDQGDEGNVLMVASQKISSAILAQVGLPVGMNLTVSMDISNINERAHVIVYKRVAGTIAVRQIWLSP